jgi:hypothetical protein
MEGQWYALPSIVFGMHSCGKGRIALFITTKMAIPGEQIFHLPWFPRFRQQRDCCQLHQREQSQTSYERNCRGCWPTPSLFRSRTIAIKAQRYGVLDDPKIHAHSGVNEVRENMVNLNIDRASIDHRNIALEPGTIISFPSADCPIL